MGKTEAASLGRNIKTRGNDVVLLRSLECFYNRVRNGRT